MTPHISMDPACHYVTQSSVWGSQYCGPLTDRKISAYRKAGYYDTGLGMGIRAKAKAKGRRRGPQNGDVVARHAGKYTF